MSAPATSFDQPRLPDHAPALIESMPSRLRMPATSTLDCRGVHFFRLAWQAWRFLPRRRWCPAWPVTTTGDETSLVPPGA